MILIIIDKKKGVFCKNMKKENWQNKNKIKIKEIGIWYNRRR